MNDFDYIAGLDIATDSGLRSLEGAPELQTPLRRAVRSAANGEVAPERALDSDLRAAVNGAAVLSFVAGVSAEEKSDVLFSTQFAQRAASAKHDRHEETDAWYRLFVEVLERLGWAGEGFAFTERTSSGGEFRMDRSALDVIATIATGNQLAILVKALDTMKGLADADGAIRVFERQAVAELSGNYQLGAVERAENGALSLALGAFRFRSNDQRRRVLFWNWGAEEIVFWTAVQRLTLNRDHYATLRAKVTEKLGAEAADYVVELGIV